MARLGYATHLHGTSGNMLRRIFTYSITDWRVSAYSLVAFGFFLILLSSRAHGDEYTGLPHDDPKDLTAPSASAPAPSAPSAASDGAITFAALPHWARGATMPALPYQLTPMGRKPVTVTTETGTQPLTPPKDTTPAVYTPMPPAAAKPANAAPEQPALIAVSPFLQWVRANPQVAAAQARQQAQVETGPAAPPVPPTPPSPNQPIPASSSPYWLPPLIDSSDFGAVPVTGGAAIYTTPQR